MKSNFAVKSQMRRNLDESKNINDILACMTKAIISPPFEDSCITGSRFVKSRFAAKSRFAVISGFALKSRFAAKSQFATNLVLRRNLDLRRNLALQQNLGESKNINAILACMTKVII